MDIYIILNYIPVKTGVRRAVTENEKELMFIH